MDDLLLIKDKKEIEDYLHPENIIDLFVRWNYLDKTNKQKLISKYIDDIEIEKLGTKIEIKKLNLRNSFYYDLIDYHNNYDTPLDLFMFMDEDKFPIPVAHNGFRTRIEIENYVNRIIINIFLMEVYMYKVSDFTKTAYRTGEAAKILGITTRTIQNYDKLGKLKVCRTEGNRRVIMREDLIKYLDDKGLIYDDTNSKQQMHFMTVREMNLQP